jgi:RsiW-degrading membrane proteinase PrsW (M82 family)
MAQEALVIASTTLQSLLLGFLPAVFWLWFWLREDPHPEPRKILIYTFITGMLAVPIALFFEELVYEGAIAIGLMTANKVIPAVIVVWALVEEYAKYSGAKLALRSTNFDEPVDAPIYLITAALGFAAVENVFFLFKTITLTPDLAFATGEMRFLGATLLHIATSATVGMSIAFAFFHKEDRRRNAFWGLVFATALHAGFNLFIINNGEGSMLPMFALVWVFCIALLLLFERIKKIALGRFE